MASGQNEPRLERLSTAIFLSGVLLWIFNAVDYATAIQPFRFQEANWRYGAVGLLGGFLLTPLLGLLLILAQGAVVRSRRALVTVAVVSLAMGVAVLVLIPPFLLDAVEVRGSVRQADLSAFTTSSAKAIFKLAAGCLVFLTLGWSGVRLARDIPKNTRTDAGQPLVVGGR